MTCAACTSTVESALKEVEGVNKALVSLPFQEVRVLHDAKTEQKEIISTIEAVGCEAVIGERGVPQKIQMLRHTEELATLRDSLKGLSIFSAVIFTLGTLLDYSGFDRLLDSAL